MVHGRDYPRAAVVDDAIRRLIRDGAAMAPLHNPPNLLGIDAASKVYPGVPQVRSAVGSLFEIWQHEQAIGHSHVTKTNAHCSVSTCSLRALYACTGGA